MGELFAPFNPITGEHSIGERFKYEIPDFPIPVQYLPVEMRNIPLIKKLKKAGSVRAFFDKVLDLDFDTESEQLFLEQFCRLRSRYDFPFWAATYVYIKRKGGGTDCLFRLTYPQRKFVSRLEEMRKAGKPIRLVMLKARQWGGSTTSQLYMAWLQLVHKVGLNSIIIAQQNKASDKIKDMFDRMIKQYPLYMLHKLGEVYQPTEAKMVGVGHSGSIKRVPQRNCTIEIGTYESPDSSRGGDYNLVHLSEVGLWEDTPGKKPEDVVRAACGSVQYRPYTMIVYESTANGVGNFFHREYVDARDNPNSQFKSMFVAWYDIEMYSLPFPKVADDETPAHKRTREAMAEWLHKNRNNDNAPSNREESGKYLWYLWRLGATLEGINWYITERAKFNSHDAFAAEFPSDDTEAFINSGANVFDKYKVEDFRPSCRPPRKIGDVYADADEGADALKNLRFREDSQGQLHIWSLPEPDTDTELVTDRYLTVVDIGGRTAKADWSVIVVFDRLGMMDGDKPCVVAQWYGHTDIDLLAWKAAQIAAFYNNSLLVIESNTADSRDPNRHVEGGDQSMYLLNQLGSVYENLYARKQSEEDIRQGLPKKYGFNTNTSTKPMVISTLVKVVREHLYIERDARCLNEMLVYERKQNGSYGAVVGAHDDLLMTRAIGLHICFNEMELPRIVNLSSRTAAFHPRSTVSEASI